MSKTDVDDYRDLLAQPVPDPLPISGVAARHALYMTDRERMLVAGAVMFSARALGAGADAVALRRIAGRLGLPQTMIDAEAGRAVKEGRV